MIILGLPDVNSLIYYGYDYQYVQMILEIRNWGKPSLSKSLSKLWNLTDLDKLFQIGLVILITTIQNSGIRV